MENKKIVFHFLNTGNYSGAENVVINIAQLVDSYKHVYVSPDGDINDILKKNNIEHISVSKLSFLSFLQTVNNYKPDIVQAHDFKASIIAGMMSKFVTSYGGKIISQLHKNDDRMNKISIISLLFWIVLKRFSRVIVVSQSVIDEYIFKNKLFPKAIVIKNIVNFVKIKKQSLELNINEYDIIYVARMSEEKGPIRFINIIEKINKRRNIRATWVGDGYMRSIVEETIAGKKLSDVINLVGFQSNPYPYINAGKVAMVTSRYEGFGLSALESQLLGKPVVSTNVGGLGEIVTKESGLLTNDDNEFVDEIIKLLDDKKYYASKHASAEKRSNEINDISEYIRKFNDIYGER